MEDRIVLFGSYNKGPEYEKKMEKVEQLRSNGHKVDLYYLLALTADDALPKRDVDRLMIANIKRAIAMFNPNILAFHNGLTLQLKMHDFVRAMEQIKKLHADLIYLLEYLNQPEKSYVFRQDAGFLKWCKTRFEQEHDLYDILWKPKIS
ncbi:hypothetical protein WIW50_07835 [Flavobacteriaceae bacterium 3-367]|uniref:hypothetical protein n=1 Tax=Eudoraea algarum TaxID=3417568 RepID=UPI00328F9A71